MNGQLTEEQREKQRASQSAWRARNCQKERERHRRYRESAHGKQTRAAYAESDARKAAQQRYDQSTKGKLRHVRSNQKHKARYPDHLLARDAVNNALKSGKLVRQPCVYCGSAKSQGHHEDYSRPLEVIWMCGPCHRAYHRGEVEA